MNNIEKFNKNKAAEEFFNSVNSNITEIYSECHKFISKINSIYAKNPSNCWEKLDEVKDNAFAYVNNLSGAAEYDKDFFKQRITSAIKQVQDACSTSGSDDTNSDTDSGDSGLLTKIETFALNFWYGE